MLINKMISLFKDNPHMNLANNRLIKHFKFGKKYKNKTNIRCPFNPCHKHFYRT